MGRPTRPDGCSGVETLASRSGRAKTNTHRECPDTGRWSAAVFAAFVLAAAPDARTLHLALLAFVNGVVIGQATPPGRAVMPIPPPILLPPGVTLTPIILLAPRILIPIGTLSAPIMLIRK